jgi:HAD superfamily hydrolase (TIGR01509 family)
LFDCDNTLVLSEDLAFEACAELANEVLEKNGKLERYTGPALLKDFVGMNFRGMLTKLCEKFNISLTPAELDDYVDRELGKVIETLEKKAQPCPGVMEELNGLHELQKYKLAVVSSSALSRVQASIKKVGMEKYFKPNWVYSAATSLPKPTSKPDPAVYLYAMEQIGVKPEECVAIEDSRSGATAAMRAKIPLIGYVGPYDEEERENMVKILRDECGAKAIMYHWSEFPKCMETVETSL